MIRSTFVVDEKGKIELAQYNVKATGHVAKLRKDLGLARLSHWTATYLEAAGSFADLVASLPTPLAGPGLGEWDLRALVGHTARSLVTVSEYLRKPAPSVDVETAADYVAGLAAVAIDPGITRRGVEAGELLGDDPAGAVRLLLDAVRADLAGADPDQVVTTYAGGMRLRDYLPTRSFELVVHGLDIAAAVPVRWTPPPRRARRGGRRGHRGRRTPRRGRASCCGSSPAASPAASRSSSLDALTPEWWNWQTRSV